MVHRLFVRGFRPLLDHSSESHFNYLGHIFGFWRSFLHHQPGGAADRESLATFKTMIYRDRITTRRIRDQGFYGKHIGRVFDGSGVRHAPRRTSSPRELQDYASFLTPSLYKYPFRESSMA